MASTFTIRNTGNTTLEIETKGESGQSQGGAPPQAQPRGQGQGQGQGETRDVELSPGEERIFTVDENSHVQVRAGERQRAEPKR